MSFKNRLKFLFGLIVVLLLVGALVLYLNNTLSTVKTTKAAINADTSTVGTDYPGLVIKQNVEEGDKVTKGETLFEIQSAQLTNNLNSGLVSASSLPFSLSPHNHNILIKATDDGVVQKVNYRAGSYAPLGSILATIDTVGSLYVEAHYNLTPPDYARIKKGSTLLVTFPDNSHETATVYNISLVGNANAVDTVIKARLQHASLGDFRFAVGTPVEASLKLSQTTWYQGVKDFVRNLFKPKGQ